MKMLKMSIPGETENRNVINVPETKIGCIPQNNIHQTLESCRCVFESKRYNSKLNFPNFDTKVVLSCDSGSEKLCSAGLTLQLPKCSLGALACEFFGTEGDPGYISPLQAKIETIFNFGCPVKKKDVHS